MPKGQIAWNKGKKFPQFSGKNSPSWKGGKVRINCLTCGNDFYIYNSIIKKDKGKYCSKKCSNIGKRNFIPWNKGKKGVMPIPWSKLHPELCKPNSGSFKKGTIPYSKLHPEIMPRGKNHPRWKEGRTINDQGYILIYSPNHPFCDNKNYVREHRLIMEKHLGRYLKPEEVVHHINDNPSDNRIKNLKLFTKGEHQRFHLLRHSSLRNAVA